MRHIGRDCEHEENPAQDVLALRHPRHQFHMERVNGKTAATKAQMPGIARRGSGRAVSSFTCPFA